MRKSSHRVRTGASLCAVSLATLLAPRAATASTVSCNIPQPCALYTNAQGPGFEGTSARSEGLLGTTTYAGTSATNRTYGVEGLDASTNKNKYNVGVYGSSPYGLGLYGISPSGTGVYATSTSGFGLRAASSSGMALTATSGSNTALVGTTSATGTSTKHAGLMGVDASTTSGVYNDGVLGTTNDGGYGVEGTSGNNAGGGVRGLATNGLGVTGQSDSGIGTYGYGPGFVGVYGSGSTSATGVYGSGYNGTGVQGYSYASYGLYGSTVSGTALGLSSSTGYGIDVTTGAGGGSGIGLRIDAANGNATDVTGSYIGLLGRSDQFPLVLTNTAGNDLFYVDGSGNIYAHGAYKTFVATRNGNASAFTPRSTTPSIEDAGTARLVDGVANVRFDPTFAASIDAQTIYQVFLTPGGDTRGLFVATKTPTGFVVRETQGGRGTLAFDYRILATAPGHAHERMAVMTPANATPKANRATHAMRALSPLADPTPKRNTNR